jgi:hypothetical protein
LSSGLVRQQYQQDGEADRLQRSAGEARLGSTSEGKREAGNVVAKVEFCDCAKVSCKTVALIGSFRDKARSREVVFFRSFPRSERERSANC